jgi:pimeloyl-ACP methyl ester carboxylesterase
MAETVAGFVVERVGSGEPLLLLHGTGCTRAVWEPVVELLGAERDLLLVDLPGHGESPSPPDGAPHNPIGYARSLAAMLDQLGLDRVECAGNSVGGWTALELAKLGRAKSVVAIAPAGLWPKRAPRRSTMQLRSQHRMGRLSAPLMKTAAGRTVLMRGIAARPRRIPPQAAVAMTLDFARTPGFNAHIAAIQSARFRDGEQIEVPVTVAWGAKERLIPRSARRSDELPSQARIVTLPNCGHLPMWDDPALVAETILGRPRSG